MKEKFRQRNRWKKREQIHRKGGMPVKKRNLIVSFLMAGFLACSSVSVFAETQTIDLKQKGTIEITLQQEELSGAVFDLYKVADISQEEDGSLAYKPSEDFGTSFRLEPDNIESDEFQAYVEDYIEQNGLEALESQTIEEDTQTCTFSDLSLGLYYVQENSSDAQKNYEVSSFLITLPSQVDGVWNYQVDASPKMQVSLQPSEEVKEPVDQVEPSQPSRPTLPQSSLTTTTLTNTPAKTSIPQTGTLLYLIPALVAAGLVLIAAGYLIRSKSNSVNH
jgi:hypothetical protein